jgi:hypothetical protein
LTKNRTTVFDSETVNLLWIDDERKYCDLDHKKEGKSEYIIL